MFTKGNKKHQHLPASRAMEGAYIATPMYRICTE